jgi:hypothetical protein
MQASSTVCYSMHSLQLSKHVQREFISALQNFTDRPNDRKKPYLFIFTFVSVFVLTHFICLFSSHSHSENYTYISNECNASTFVCVYMYRGVIFFSSSIFEEKKKKEKALKLNSIHHHIVMRRMEEEKTHFENYVESKHIFYALWKIIVRDKRVIVGCFLLIFLRLQKTKAVETQICVFLIFRKDVTWLSHHHCK